MGDSNADTIATTRVRRVHDVTTDDVRPELDIPIERSHVARLEGERSLSERVRCSTCDVVIEPQEYRLSWVVTSRETTVERHYCSEPCLPDEATIRASDRSDGSGASRDWSYCR
ncbi:hypothetical protein [Natrialba sp. INN-245]|uniref:hypothetical protein n=1 Tax=Natrialba sp. INN-245 TaxID=2690967 RepID=UPI00130FCCA6|nr:hypothetical protein [Natrialba sp. INN-245]MWV39862.1 hypothetical protein [Natrialba sp. INN-245]